MVLPLQWRCGEHEGTCGHLQGPEIRTGFLEGGNPIKLTAGGEVTITTDYEAKGKEGLIAMRCLPPHCFSRLPQRSLLRCMLMHVSITGARMQMEVLKRTGHNECAKCKLRMRMRSVRGCSMQRVRA
jgi:hypothetical protein